MAITIKDVARAAGVSPSTVSRVVANDSRISEETKAKVNEVVQRLKYTPNVIARGLANNKTKTLGIVLPREAEDFFSNPFLIQAMKGISICAQEHGYYIVNAFSKNEGDVYKYVVDLANSKLVDGICLLTAEEEDKCIEYLQSTDFPFVVIGRPEKADNILWVDNDNVKAMFGVVNNLINRGHRNIGFIGASKKMNMSKDRLKGYIDALYSKDIELNTNFIKQGENFDIEYGKNAMNELISQGVTAVVTTDDMLSMGALEVINKNNANIKIVGFNNIPLTKFQNPPLASVDINGNDLGYYACNLLISKLEGYHNNRRNYIVETKLIERESMQ